jgi:phosphatidylethanolamine/phosphatidyl-N-methylethanolamine N-methyltransferase
LATQMNTVAVAKAYDRWAPFYDLVFGAVFRQGRSDAIRAAERVGGRILEVGIGTGISLPGYSRSSRIVGVDISPDMLEKARARVERLGLTNVEDIRVDDAERLSFGDNAFDVVVAQYVVSAVPHPVRALDECARVCRPGGEIIITTRVSAESGFRGGVERALMPITSRLGFRTEFPFSLYTDWVAGRSDVALIESRPIPPFGHFSLVRFAKLAA